MSTFDGIIEEFPDIRIDYFRSHAGRTPPAAVFLSHVHSDHLLGLETLKMPFIYCSLTTRRILLKMEKYPHRINFAKGVLEARKQTYKHLKLILRALPLDTPVELEISPKCRIHVTLLDANHCPGAVMFLIEDSSRAILYTGDVRAESWWVNSLTRNPAMIPYTMGQKRLDCVYLDTTFASHEDIYKHFPSKAEGLSELLSKVSRCPSGSVFYFRAWTLGYEDVWVALSTALRSKVHVDEYQQRLFRPGSQDGSNAYPTAALTGHRVGNQEHEGCLTRDREVRIHSCEPGMACHAALRKQSNIVWITPIISRHPDGTEMAEIGAGGGKGDLYQLPVLDLRDDAAQQALKMLCDNLMGTKGAAAYLETAFAFAMTQRDFRFALEGLGLPPDEEMTLERFVEAIAERPEPTNTTWDAGEYLKSEQKVIHFPYSRHSSYSELRELIGALRPQDICPCTVDLDSWREDVSMGALFGDLCTSSVFRHDCVIREQAQLRQAAMRDAEQPSSSPVYGQDSLESDRRGTALRLDPSQDPNIDPLVPVKSPAKDGAATNVPQRRFRDAWRMANPDSQTLVVGQDGKLAVEAELNETQVSVATSILDLKESYEGDWAAYAEAYDAAKTCLSSGDSDAWNQLGIRSVGWRGHTEPEMELG